MNYGHSKSHSSFIVEGGYGGAMDDYTAGCMRLVAAKFLLHVQEYVTYRRRKLVLDGASPARRRKGLERSCDGTVAERWFSKTEEMRDGEWVKTENIPFTFRWSCAILGLDADRVLLRVKLDWINIYKNMSSPPKRERKKRVRVVKGG